MEYSVLLISSAEFFATEVANFLGERGFPTQTINPFDETFGEFNNEQYKAIIIDRGLIEISTGISLIKNIRLRSPKTKTILLDFGDSDGKPNDLNELYDNFDHVVNKPFDPEMLAVSIESNTNFEDTSYNSSNPQDKSQNLFDAKKSLQLSNFLNSTRDLTTILRLTCQAAKELTNADGSSAVYFSPLYDYAKPVAAYPDKHESEVKHINLINIQNIEIENELITNKEPILIPDIKKKRQELGYVFNILTGLGVQSTIFIPIIIDDKVIASFSLDYLNRNKFTNKYIGLCKELASQASIAISKLSFPQNQIVFPIEKGGSNVFNNPNNLELKDLLSSIVKNTVELLQAESGGILVYDKLNEELVLKASIGLNPNFLDQTIKLGEGVSGRLIQSNEPFIIINNYHKWPGRIKELEGLLGTVATIPLKSYNGVIGTFFVSKDIDSFFSEEEIWSISLFAEKAANTIEQFQRIEDNEHTKQIFQTIADISNQLAPEKALEAIQDKSVELLRCDAVEVFGYDQNRKNLYSLKNNFEEKSLRKLGLEQLISAFLNKEYPVYSDQLVVEDVKSNVTFRNNIFFQELGVYSFVARPLRVMDSLVGIMFINYKSKHQFSTRELETIRFLGEHAAISLHNSQLYEKIQRQAKVNQVLFDAAKLMTQSLNLEEVLKQICKQVILVIESENYKSSEKCFSHIALIEDNYLHFVATFPETINKLLFEKGHLQISLRGPETEKRSIALKAVNNEITFNIDNVLEDPDYISLRDDIRSQISVPLKFGGTIIGVLSIEHTSNNGFTIEDKQNIEALSSQAAIAIHNARQLQRLKAAYEVTNTQKTSESPKSRLEKILEQACKVLKSTSIKIQRMSQTKSIQQVVEWPSNPIFNSKNSSSNKVSEKVFETRKPQFFPDVQSNIDSLSTILRNKEIKSIACLPLLVSDICIGVIWVQYDWYHSFNSVDVTDLEFYADLIAIAYDDAKQVDDLLAIHQLAIEVFSTISNFSYQTSRFVSMEKIAQNIKNFMECDSVVIYSYNTNEGQLEFPPAMIDVVFREQTMRTAKVPESSIIYEILKNHQQPYKVSDTSKDDKFSNRSFVKLEGVKSCVAVPLIGVKDTVGVMFVNYLNVHEFHKYELTNLDLLGRYAALTIQTTLLLEKMEVITKKSSEVELNSFTVETILRLNEAAQNLLNNFAHTSSVKFDKGTIHYIENNNRYIIAKFGYTENEVIEELSRPINEDDLIKSIINAPYLKPLIISNTNLYPLWENEKYKTTRDVNSWIGVPLVVNTSGGKSKLVGLLTLDKSQVNFYKENDQKLIDTLTEFAEKVAFEIKEKIDFAKTQLVVNLQEQKTALISAFREIANSINLTEMSPNEENLALTSILNWTRQLLSQPDLVEIRLLDASKENLVSFYSTGKPIKDIYKQTPITIGITGKAAIESKIIYVPDITQTSNYLPFIDGMGSELAIPLRSQGYVFGVLNIEHKDKNAFDSETQNLANALSDLVGSVITNNKIIAELKKSQTKIAEAENMLASSIIAMDQMHLINNAINLIPNWAHLGREQIQELKKNVSNKEFEISKDNLYNILNDIEKATNNITEKVRSIQEVNTEEEEINIVELIKIIVSEYRLENRLENRSIVFEEKYDIPDQEIKIKAVKRQLQTAFYNILKNSVKAVLENQDQRETSQPDICVKVSLKEADIKGPEVQIEFADRGIPIRIDQQNMVFELGFSNWSHQPGLGYGLWRARNIITELKGSIELTKSTIIQNGKSFIVSLPVI